MIKYAIKKTALFFLVLLVSQFTLATARIHIKLKRIADTKTLIPNTFLYFSKFAVPAIDQGQIVFRGHTDHKENICHYINGKLKLIAMAQKTYIPSTKHVFYHFIDNLKIANTSRPMIFNNIITFVGSARNPQEHMGIFTYSLGKIKKIADLKTPLPEAAKGLFTTFFDPKITGNGSIVFHGGNNKITGLFSTNTTGQIIQLADTHTHIPNGIGNFTAIYQPACSHNHQQPLTCVFIGKGKNAQSGIYLYKNGTLMLVADDHTQIPKGLGHFIQFNSPAYDSKTDLIAFVGKGILGQQGIYVFDGKSIKKAIDQESLVPQNLFKFYQFSNPSLDNNMLLFKGIDGKHHEGLYLTVPPFSVYKIISDLDTIDKKNINKIEIGSNALNNNQITFLVTLKNHLKVIYLGKLSFTS